MVCMLVEPAINRTSHMSHHAYVWSQQCKDCRYVIPAHAEYHAQCTLMGWFILKLLAVCVKSQCMVAYISCSQQMQHKFKSTVHCNYKGAVNKRSKVIHASATCTIMFVQPICTKTFADLWMLSFHFSIYRQSVRQQLWLIQPTGQP